MAYKAFKDEEFKKMCKAAKEKSVAFAFGLGSSDSTHVFALDDDMGGKALFAKIKSEKGLSKGAWGSCRVNGTCFEITPEKSVSKLKAHIIALAKSKGWQVNKVKVVGGVDEDEADEMEEEEMVPGTSGAPGASPTARGLELEGVAAPAPPPVDKKAVAAKIKALNGKIDKCQQAWDASHTQALKQLRALQKSLLALKHPLSAAAVKGFEKVHTELGTIDKECAAVKSVASSKGADAAQAEINALQNKVNAMLTHVSSNTLLQDADENPLVKTTMRATLTKALKAIQSTLR